MRVLITGGCGFIGTNLSLFLKSKGFKTVPQIFYPDGEHYGNYHDLEKKYVWV